MDTETIASAVLNEEQLSLDLIEAQYALMNTRDQSNAKSLVILVSGIELAGKGEAVKQLREWVDPRFLYVKADPPHLFNLKQPFWQPYTRFVKDFTAVERQIIDKVHAGHLYPFQ